MPRGRDLETLVDSLPEEWKDLPIFSYSQLQTQDRCSFEWYTKYALKLKIKSNSSKRMDVGEYTHLFLADLYQQIADHGMSTTEWVEERLNPMVLQIIDGLHFEDQISSVAVAMKLMQRYCRSNVLSGHAPVGIEQHFFVVVEAPSGRYFVLQGYIDLLTIDMRNQVWAWDHGTTEWMKRNIHYKALLQLPVYQVLLQADGMPVTGICVNLLNSRDYKDMDAQPDAKMFKRDFKIWTPGQLSNIWNEFMALADETLDMVEGKIKARRSIRHDCDRCDMYGPCMANLAGEPLEDAMIAYSNSQANLRGIPAGTSVTLDLEGM